MADDDALILRAATEGRTIRDIAAERGMSEESVAAILDREAATWFDGKHLRRELLMEVTRLNALARKYYSRAMGDDEGSITAGTLYVKLTERKATLIGLNAPAAASVQLIHQTAPVEQRTSTQEIIALLDNVQGITARERELIDRRELNGEDTPEIRREINELRAARGKQPLEIDPYG